MREKGEIMVPSLWTRRAADSTDVHIPFNEQISGLTANSNEKQRVGGCTISSDLLLLLQIKTPDDICGARLQMPAMTSAWTACCSSGGELWFHWRIRRLLTQFYHFCQQSTSIYPFIPAAVTLLSVPGFHSLRFFNVACFGFFLCYNGSEM